MKARHQNPSATLGGRLAVAAALGLALWLGADPVDAMPPNARQIDGGYWIGAAPSVEDIDALYAAGVRVIVSLTPIDPEAKARARLRGIRRAKLWFGMNFPDPSDVAAAMRDDAPETIYIHCEWGADRTGAVAAYLLVTQVGWEPHHALLSMVYTAEKDISRLRGLPRDEGYEIPDEGLEDLTSMYSGARTGGTGGLKIRSDDYKTLVRSTLTAARAELRVRAILAGLHNGAARGYPPIDAWDQHAATLSSAIAGGIAGH